MFLRNSFDPVASHQLYQHHVLLHFARFCILMVFLRTSFNLIESHQLKSALNVIILLFFFYNSFGGLCEFMYFYGDFKKFFSSFCITSAYIISSYIKYRYPASGILEFSWCYFTNFGILKIFLRSSFDLIVAHQRISTLNVLVVNFRVDSILK